MKTVMDEEKDALLMGIAILHLLKSIWVEEEYTSQKNQTAFA